MDAVSFHFVRHGFAIDFARLVIVLGRGQCFVADVGAWEHELGHFRDVGDLDAVLRDGSAGDENE